VNGRDYGMGVVEGDSGGQPTWREVNRWELKRPKP